MTVVGRSLLVIVLASILRGPDARPRGRALGAKLRPEIAKRSTAPQDEAYFARIKAPHPGVPPHLGPPRRMDAGTSLPQRTQLDRVDVYCAATRGAAPFPARRCPAEK